MLGTLDPQSPKDPSKIHSSHKYSTPIPSSALAKAQKKIPLLNNELFEVGVSVAGAWMGMGVHEDGFRAGIDATERLGGKMPFERVKADREVGLVGWVEWVARWVIVFIGWMVCLLCTVMWDERRE